MYIQDDGIRLNAKLDMPANYRSGMKCPLVVVIHGYGSNELRAAQAIALTTGVDHVFFTDVPMPHPWNGFSGNYTC